VTVVSVPTPAGKQFIVSERGEHSGAVIVHVDLEPNAHAPTVARRHVVEVLRCSGIDPETIEDSCLAVSELTTNALLHAAGAFALEISVAGDVVHLVVVDHSIVLPRRVPASATGGRGLEIVTRVSRRWGADPLGDGKAVWCDLHARRGRIPDR